MVRDSENHFKVLLFLKNSNELTFLKEKQTGFAWERGGLEKEDSLFQRKSVIALLESNFEWRKIFLKNCDSICVLFWGARGFSLKPHYSFEMH